MRSIKGVELTPTEFLDLVSDLRTAGIYLKANADSKVFLNEVVRAAQETDSVTSPIEALIDNLPILREQDFWDSDAEGTDEPNLHVWLVNTLGLDPKDQSIDSSTLQTAMKDALAQRFISVRTRRAENEQRERELERQRKRVEESIQGEAQAPLD